MSHPCPKGVKCRDFKNKDPEHIAKFTHEDDDDDESDEESDSGSSTTTPKKKMSRQVTISSSLLPDNWDAWDHKKTNLKIIELMGKKKYEKEVDAVLKSFRKSAKISKVVSVKRVQNFRMWMQYWGALERVKARSINKNKNDVEQKWLFHGCRTESNLEDIVNNGFDQQRANSCPYGVWFAQQAVYSWKTGYTRQYPDGTHEIVCARVVTGTPGDDDGSGRRAYVPGTVKKQKTKKAAFAFSFGASNVVVGPNSVLADCQTHMQGKNRIFVVYRADQCYPEYILRGS
eukprot:Rmarinus@m.26789